MAVAVAGGLQREQPRVGAAARDQLVVGAELADPSLAEHGDAIGAAQAAEPVRDQEPRAPGAVAREGAMHAMLGLGLGVEPRARPRHPRSPAGRFDRDDQCNVIGLLTKMDSGLRRAFRLMER